MNDQPDTGSAVAAYLSGPMIEPTPAQGARSAVSVGLGANPDFEAELKRVARSTGVPVDTVRAYPDELKRQAQIGTIDFNALAERLPRTAGFLSGVENAKVAHDDIENMGLIETLVNSFKRGVPALRSMVPTLELVNQSAGLNMYRKIDERIAAGEDPKAVLSDYGDYGLAPLPWHNSEQALAGWNAFKVRAIPVMQARAGEAAADVTRFQAERNAITLPGVVERTMVAKTWGDAFSQIGTDPLRFIAAIGPESLVQTAPGLLAAIPAGIAAGPAGSAATIGGNSALVDYASSLVEAMQGAGIDVTSADAIRTALKDPEVLSKIVEQAGKHAAVVGAFDALSGGIAGKMLLPKTVAGKLSGRPLAQEMANIALQVPIQGALGAAGEAGGELAAGQDLQPGNILAEAFGEFFGTPGEVVSASAKRISAKVTAAQEAEVTATHLQQLDELAKASKVRARDADTFESFVKSASDGSPLQDVFIDANTLMQSGMAEQVAAVSPSVAAQLSDALATGGDIKIPVAEYVSRLAGTELSQGLLDHLKTEPNGMSRAEAQEFMQSQAETLKAEVEKTLAEKQGDELFKAHAEAVKTQVREQLDQVSRFTGQVNDAYASMVSNFYAVMSAKLGISPQDLFARYPLKIAAESVTGGQVLEQGADTTFDWSNPGGGSREVKVGDSTIAYGYDGKSAHIISLRTPSAKRNKGSARAAMKQFLRETDALGIPVKLESSPLDKRTKDARLFNFYKSLGFEPTGKRINAAGDPEMLRQPQQLNQSPQPLPATINIDGAERPTVNSNGQPIAATEEGVRNFWRWFGDSKVVDVEGRPLVVYHGTTRGGFTEFKQHDRSRSVGYVFTSDKNLALTYSGQDNSAEPGERSTKSGLYTAYLKAEKLQSRDWGGAHFGDNGGTDAAILAAKESGADGIVMRNVDDAGAHKGMLVNRGKIPEETGVGDVFAVFTPEQIKSAIGNSGEFDPSSANILHQSTYNRRKKAKRDDYTLDLFDIPTNPREDRPAEGPSPGQPAGLSRDDATGTYATRTELVKENTRTLGTNRVNTPEDAAQALAYLGKGAVERFDALITDSDGTPIAIVGAFKGALSQASVYPSTLAAEAYRVRGAAKIWFAHNHPSGMAELSEADRRLHLTISEVFRGSEIESQGLFAIGGREGDGRRWVFEPTGRNVDLRGTTSAPTREANVPVVERVITEDAKLGPAIDSPRAAREAARNMSGGNAGAILMDNQHVPVAFVPIQPDVADTLRVPGRMDGLWRALSMANASAAIIVNNGGYSDEVVRNLAGFFSSSDTRVLDVMSVSGDRVRSYVEEGRSFASSTFRQGTGNRGSFNPATNTITLLKNADLSTFLHESGHFFLETQFDIAAKLGQEAVVFGAETNKPGETQILKDTHALLKWFGVESLQEWYSLDFEQKRGYHEQFARGFEAYLFEGKAPSIELQGLFQRFRAWLLNIYRDIKNLNVELTDEVRSVFDRMLATTDEIKLAEQGRSMMPLFTSPEQAGMTPEEFAAYQALGVDATNDAIQDVQARGLRDLAWVRNARGREIKRLQKESAAKRSEVQIEVRREVMSQPVYRAWQFLTGKIGKDDKLTPATPQKSDPKFVNPELDSLLVAIAKLGGISRESASNDLGVHADYHRVPSGVFGKPVFRKDGGKTADAMAKSLAELGYLPRDTYDLHDLEDRISEELRGNLQYSYAHDYQKSQGEQRAGDGLNLEALGAGRFDTLDLKNLDIPAEIIEHITNLKMTAANGIHPDLVAELFGFSSGDELVRTLAAAQEPKVEIEGLTDARMLERYGELATPAAIERAADKAIHNEARARFVATEVNALSKATGSPKILASAARDFARSMISRLKIRDIRPGQYAAAEVRAAKAAERASTSGDLVKAAAEKRNQLINTFATRAAYDAQDEVDKGLRYLKKFDGDIKDLDVDYADQIGALLERFDLRKQSLKSIDKRTALAEWVKSQREQGLEPDIPAQLENEAFRKSYKDMTVEEFRGLVDTVKQIEHLGRLKNRLLTAADNRAFSVVRDEIAAGIEEHAGDRTADTRTPTTNLGRALQTMRRFYASHIKVATWARVMDGGRDGGPVWEYFVRSANERGDMETTMRAEATARLAEILAPVFKLGKMGGKGQFFPSIGRSLNREARITIALNTGNEGNLQRLLGGEGWTLAQLTPIMQALTSAEWRAVQAVWDHMESYREQIGAKERRVYGKEPTWVESKPIKVQTADGETLDLRGGYYPIKYDPAASQRAEEHADAEGAKRQLQGAYTSATTRRSFTKTRAEEVSGRPLLYTLAGMYSGVNDVIHDLAWHEWLIDANRLLRSKTIDNAIRTHYGPEVKAQFKTWANDIAEGEKGADNAGELALSRLRQGVSAAGLGFNVMSALMQPLGLTQSIVRVGAPWIGRGVARYLASPLDSTREVNGKSDFMANRARTRFRELNELRNQVQDQSATKEIIGRYAYFLMMRCQQMVDTPTWIGAYEKAIAAGNEEERAIGLADQAVIDAQGGGQTKDLASIERGGPALRLFTVFYSFMNTALNIGVAQTMTASSKAKLAADYLLLFVVPPVLGYMLKHALTPGDDSLDDPEKLAKELLAQELDYLMGLMVVVREFAEAAKIVTGANDKGRDYTGPAGLSLVSDSVGLAKQAHQGEFDDAFRKAAVNVVGDLFGLPAAQVNRTITGTQAIAEGKTSNPAAIAFGYQEKR